MPPWRDVPTAIETVAVPTDTGGTNAAPRIVRRETGPRETEFNRLRATAFPRAYFEKDNDARTGSKGDFIFKDSDADGTEIVSIMFEMKNEADRTATKGRKIGRAHV